MRSSNPLNFCKVLAFALLFCAPGAAPASAQTGVGATEPPPRPAADRRERRPPTAAHESEMACGGFIEQQAAKGQPQIVGAEQERERRVFGQGDLLFIDAGAQKGLRVGQEFEVTRPRGQFRSKFSHKGGSLGVYTQEVGQVRVVRVRERVSVAEVTLSCSDLLLGDLLRPLPQRDAPAAHAEVNLDHFAEPTGKQTGHIVLARDGRETLSRDEVVFIDLGAEDNVKVGDYLTVFRPEGRGTIVEVRGEVTANSRRGYESDEFRGGRFSNESQRVKDVDGSEYGNTVKTASIKRQRPPVPRLTVGEVVVLRVEGRTATAIITRAAQEIHTGDSVELQ
ncbi:MAG TPA: hypothetical protein VHU19_10775 [Pyrinomonadaceae bacterium]|nr:hypothetical protein [Pyrinomonadaceae bacterium]